MTERVAYRSLEIRKREDGKREFVLATERAVNMGGMREVLLMRGCNLARFQANPVLLDSHDRFSISAMLGSARNIRVVGSELVFEPDFADTERGNEARALVESGHLRTSSVGYRVNAHREIMEGSTDEETGTPGPAVIAVDWEPFEASLVPIPADQNALARCRAYGLTPDQEAGMADSVYAKAAGSDAAKPADSPPAAATHTPDPLAARAEAEAARRALVMSWAGDNEKLRQIAQRGLLAGHEPDAIRAAMADAYASTMPPISDGPPAQDTPAPAFRFANVDDADFARAFGASV